MQLCSLNLFYQNLKTHKYSFCNNKNNNMPNLHRPLKRKLLAFIFAWLFSLLQVRAIWKRKHPRVAEERNRIAHLDDGRARDRSLFCCVFVMSRCAQWWEKCVWNRAFCSAALKRWKYPRNTWATFCMLNIVKVRD